MKKLLTVLALIAVSSSVIAAPATSSSRVETYVNKKLAPVTAKEKELNAKAEANRKANEARQAELQKKQAADKAAFQKKQQEAQARRNATKDAINAEKNYWKNISK